MKKTLIKTALVLGTIVSLTACQSPLSGAVKKLRDPSDILHPIGSYELYRDPDYLAFKGKLREFSHKLSKAYVTGNYDNKKNITISPLSIEMALGLAVYAATGETREELLKALDIDYDTFNSYYHVFYDQLTRESKNDLGEIISQLLLTNSIWIDKDVQYFDKGLDDLKNNYYCYSYEADFDGHNKESNQAIKDFIKKNTKGLINPEMKLSPETLFVLMNTLYLKDLWNIEGNDLSLSKDAYDFKNGDGTTKNTKLLTGNYNLGRTLVLDDYSTFYTTTSHNYYLYFIKPNAGKNIKDVFKEDNISYILDSTHYVYQDDVKLERYHTNCLFPEYDASGDIDLIKLFIDNFNVKLLFNQAGSLSNICKTPVYVEEFRHLAKLKIDKKGIEGAAVTYLAYAGAAGPDEYKDVYETFTVDQEFGFVLTTSEKDVLFSGVVSNIK